MRILSKCNAVLAYGFRLLNQKRLYYRAIKIFSKQLSNTLSYKARCESPVIIIGMHRSGTTLTTRLLEDLGLSMGIKQGKSTSEDLFFQNLNELLLSMSNATWDNPSAMSQTLQNKNWLLALTKMIDIELKKSKSNHLKMNISDKKNKNLWGFKDPRSTYTLPVWINIFPNAKVINIVRDGKSVASSLLNRGNENLINSKFLSLVSLDTSLSLELWASYVTTAKHNCSSLSDEQYLEIKYETLLQSPEPTILQILNFLKLDVNKKLITKATSRVKHPNSTINEITDIPSTAKEVLQSYGYNV